MAQLFSMSDAGLSRARAFRCHGVTLKFPARSRSGLRSDDGMVVFAMPAGAVRMDEWGSMCPLWLPADRASESAGSRSISEEVLEHCRLAVRHGIAEGFVLHPGGPFPHGPELLALRVIKAGEEYWAKWGCAARAELPRRHALAESASLP
jgi:hypothetical protein